MVLDKWSTGDLVPANVFNNRTIRRGTTTEIDAVPDADVGIGDLFYDSTLGVHKIVLVVSPRSYKILSSIGPHHFWVPATAMYPAVTSPANFAVQRELVTNDVDIIAMVFQGTTANEIAKFDWTPPQNWDAGTVKCKPYWTGPAGAGTVEFEFSAVAFANTDAMDAAFGTAIASTDTFTAADELHISPQTAAITIAGSPVVADFSFIQFKIVRDQATDTKSENAELLGFVLEYKILEATSEG